MILTPCVLLLAESSGNFWSGLSSCRDLVGSTDRLLLRCTAGGVEGLSGGRLAVPFAVTFGKAGLLFAVTVGEGGLWFVLFPLVKAVCDLKLPLAKTAHSLLPPVKVVYDWPLPSVKAACDWLYCLAHGWLLPIQFCVVAILLLVKLVCRYRSVVAVSTLSYLS